MSTFLKQLTQDIQAACFMGVSLFMCTKRTTSVYEKVISEQLKFAHLPRSTLCETWSCINMSKYRYQLILISDSCTQLTFLSHAVCLRFILIMTSYSHFHWGN